MGLTLHYKLHWAPPGPMPGDEEALKLVKVARRKIVRAKLGRSVTEVRNADGRAFGGLEFKSVRLKPREDGVQYHIDLEIRPLKGFLFTLDLGADCEPATMGLCRYPKTTWKDNRDWPTKLDGWRLTLFAKTQYASLHGWEHFRRCHLGLIAALEIWQALGVKVKISDEGGYWPRKSERALRRELDMMNGVVAGIAGALKDMGDAAGGPPVQSPIFAHREFERLEAQGVARQGAKIVAAVRRVGATLKR